MPPHGGSGPALLKAALRCHGLLPKAAGAAAWGPRPAWRGHPVLARALSSALPSEEAFEGLEDLFAHHADELARLGDQGAAAAAADAAAPAPGWLPGADGGAAAAAAAADAAAPAPGWLPGADGGAAAAAAAAEAEAAAAAEAAALGGGGETPSEGSVEYRSAPLWATIRAHYAKLSAAMPEYTARVDLDTFGSLYVEQARPGAAGGGGWGVRREEAARQRALLSQQAQTVKDAKAGRPTRQVGGVLSGVMRQWTQLLEEAVEAEQQEVIRAGHQRSSGGGRDARTRERAAFGPYLLLLAPSDVAALAVHTVLSKVAATRPSDGADGGEASARAACAPAVLVAEALGGVLNDRLKWIRYKAAVAEARREVKAKEAARRRHAAAAAAVDGAGADGGGGSGGGTSGDSGWAWDGSGGGPAPGPLTLESMEGYRADAAAAAGMHRDGLARLQQLVAGTKLPRNWQRQVTAATQSASWDINTRIKVGAVVLSLLVENSPVPPARAAPRGRGRGRVAGGGGGGSGAAVPAFAYTYRRMDGGLKEQAFVDATQALVHLLNTDGSLLADQAIKSPPMLIPPEPWDSFDRGGYLTYRMWMMRTRWSWHVKEELRARLGEYPRVLDALNVLGGTPWRINRPVYEAMRSLYEGRSTAAGLPVQEPLKPPRPPGSTFRLIWEGGCLHARGGAPAAQERRLHRLASDEVRRLNRNIASMHADFRIKWRVAQEYAECPEFYYPHNLDFRGRAYPIHPSLQHLGDDLCRGLLTFAHPRPLGPHGLDWLFVHFANLWGQGEDKRSFDARRRFTRSHLPQILACAQDPLSAVWWQGAEKPWQALAACFEIAGALASLDPEKYESRLPTHMDGSCNGLQHYAALGRDEAGGRAVNLLPAEVPQDVYSGVAAIVAARVEADARAGSPEGLRLVGLVDRKLVKQTVMTSVYGVTPVGARAQIEARLRERGALDGDKEALFKASRYLAEHTMGAIGEMFSGAKGIMAWLADCAREVASYRPGAAQEDGGGGAPARRSVAARDGEEAGRPVQWVTPMGLPVTQPYFRTPTHMVSTVTQNFSVHKDDGDKTSRVTRARQRSAFPPNYIHSLDSTHMMLTALRCRAEGLTFAGVHDSFWTHAGSVSSMNRLLREEFVALHTGADLLGDLGEQLRARYPGISLPPLPPRGGLDVSRVRKSRYFFS
ncbi:MAG: hypothetical protein J3K34DRAFT_460646 [Monoraphidium minutum]|nr:MAG: hypothetical protein J3K34DRAFT_460646 [Monoraphidium minutum]